MRAARHAIFIESADVVPIIQGSTYREYFDSLQEQYFGLAPEVRRRARVQGRRRIREQGLEAAALRLIHVPLPVCGVAKLRALGLIRVSVSQERVADWKLSQILDQGLHFMWARPISLS